MLLGQAKFESNLSQGQGGFKGFFSSPDGYGIYQEVHILHQKMRGTIYFYLSLFYCNKVSSCLHCRLKI